MDNERDAIERIDAYKPVNERTFSPVTKITGCTEHHDIEMKLCLLCELAIKSQIEAELRARVKELEDSFNEYLSL